DYYCQSADSSGHLRVF
nr:immunoglobulin light chain junction region [Macaca mulatta]MOW56759.1 immunoglobulin light chain junction region [Macaca mulatta]MOW56786.1 immunoglobulin light chain junction region [Macaca mulatta]MOW57010.1 immunoglobulin light chain junction region [Macaca mulatta]MOW57218.1 immunoglobulin light chain junction region [Macaca mulatta]